MLNESTQIAVIYMKYQFERVALAFDQALRFQPTCVDMDYKALFDIYSQGGC